MLIMSAMSPKISLPASGGSLDLFARLNLDGFAGCRIATHARRAFTHLEDAETAGSEICKPSARQSTHIIFNARRKRPENKSREATRGIGLS